MMSKVPRNRVGRGKTMDSLTYQIIRSRKRRKTIALTIGRDGSIMIRAPWGAKGKEIDEFFHAKRAWLHKKREQIRREQKEQRAKEFVPGEHFLYLGQRYPLKIVKGGKEPLSLQGDGFHLSEGFEKQARDVFVQWYKARTDAVIGERIPFFSRRLNVSPRRERVTSATCQWGACSPQNTLTFSWRMAMAPIPVIDYIIVHELAHIREKNHSQKFWGIVGKIFPEYRKARDWLRRNGVLLDV